MVKISEELREKVLAIPEIQEAIKLYDEILEKEHDPLIVLRRQSLLAGRLTYTPAEHLLLAEYSHAVYYGGAIAALYENVASFYYCHNGLGTNYAAYKAAGLLQELMACTTTELPE